MASRIINAIQMILTLGLQETDQQIKLFRVNLTTGNGLKQVFPQSRVSASVANGRGEHKLGLKADPESRAACELPSVLRIVELCSR